MIPFHPGGMLVLVCLVSLLVKVVNSRLDRGSIRPFEIRAVDIVRVEVLPDLLPLGELL